MDTTPIESKQSGVVAVDSCLTNFVVHQKGVTKRKALLKKYLHTLFKALTLDCHTCRITPCMFRFYTMKTPRKQFYNVKLFVF